MDGFSAGVDRAGVKANTPLPTNAYQVTNLNQTNGYFVNTINTSESWIHLGATSNNIQLKLNQTSLNNFTGFLKFEIYKVVNNDVEIIEDVVTNSNPDELPFFLLNTIDDYYIKVLQFTDGNLINPSVNNIALQFDFTLYSFSLATCSKVTCSTTNLQVPTANQSCNFLTNGSLNMLAATAPSSLYINDCGKVGLATGWCNNEIGGVLNINSGGVWTTTEAIYAESSVTPNNFSNTSPNTSDLFYGAEGTGYGVPTHLQNSITGTQGFQNARSGGTYIGAALLEASSGYINRREWFTNIQPLNFATGKKYYVSVYTNLMDFSSMALKNFGFAFYNSTGSFNAARNCQIVASNIISNKLNWTLISGVFQAPSLSSQLPDRFDIRYNRPIGAIGTLPSSSDLQALSNYDATAANQYAYYLFDDFLIQPLADAGPDASICIGDAVTIGSPCAIVDPNVTFLWSPSSGLSSTTIANPTVNLTTLGSVTYTVTVRHTNGTTSTADDVIATDAVTITVKPKPIITLPSQTVCSGQTVSLSPISNMPPLSNTSWGFSNNMPGYNMTQTGISFVTNGPNVYTITYSGTAPNGCSSLATATITSLETPISPIINGPFSSCSLSQTYNVGQLQSGVIYTWSITAYGGTIGANPITVSQTGPQITFPYQNWEGDVTLTATNQTNGCTSSFTLHVLRCDCAPDPISTLTFFDGIHSFTEYSTASTITNSNLLNKIYVSGTLNITQNVTFSGIEVVMFANAKIVVAPGVTFSLLGSTVRACQDMWDGIYVNGTTSIIKVNNSIIQDGINAISSTNGGIINVENNSIFNKNFKHITISNYTNSIHSLVYQGYVRENTKFTCSQLSTGLPQGLRPPYTGQNTAVCIQISNVDNITIGSGSYTKNIFERAVYGIYFKESNVTVYKNEFRNILNTNTSYFCPCAIGTAICGRGYAAASSLNLTKAVIGSNSAYTKNIIYNASNAIDLKLNINARIMQNDIYNISNTGILVSSNTVDNNVGNLITLNNLDNIKQFYIKFDNNNLCRKDIISNNINQNTNISLITGYDAAAAISITEPNNSATTLNCSANISSNLIDKVRIGIDLFSIKNLTCNTNYINLITLPFNNSNSLLSMGLGIKANNCKNNSIVDNTILYANQSNWWTNGIWIQDCKNNKIECNSIGYAGVGLRFEGFCSSATEAQNNNDNFIRKNRMHSNYYGLWVNNGAIGHQYSLNSHNALIANRNFWTGNYTAGTHSHTRFDYFGTTIPNIYQAKNSRIYVPNFPTTNTYATWNEVQCPGCGMNPPQFLAYSQVGGLVNTIPFYNSTNVLYPGSSTAQTINLAVSGLSYNASCSSTANDVKDDIGFVVVPNDNPIIATQATLTTQQSAEWWEKYNLYKVLVDNPEAVAVDAAAQEFYDNTKNEAIGKLEDVKQRMLDSLYQDSLGMAMLKQQNTYIVTNNPLEEYFKEVNEKFLEVYALNVDSIPDSTSIAYLQNVAALCPAMYGPAVYYARTLLRNFEEEPNIYTSDCEQLTMAEDGSNNRRSNIINPLPATELGFSPLPTDEDETIITPPLWGGWEGLMYPNPANDEITIEGIWSSADKVSVSITNSLGNLMLKEDKININKIKINLSKLASGLYFVDVMQNGQHKQVQKLTIIK